MKYQNVNPSRRAGAIIERLGRLLLLVPLIASSRVGAEIYVEDFETPTGSAGFDPLFNHQPAPIAPLNYLSWEFVELAPIDLAPGGYGVGLWPATDLITFNLRPGQYVTYASVDAWDYASGTFVQFLGTEGEFTYTAHYPNGATFNTGDLSIGIITGIRLTSYEGIYDNIAITVVPEPTAAGLFAAGCLLLFQRFRRPTDQHPAHGQIQETGGQRSEPAGAGDAGMRLSRVPEPAARRA